MGRLIVIDDDNFEQFTDPNSVGRAMGCVPRHYGTHPLGCYSSAKPFPADLLIPRNEWVSRLRDQQQAKATLADVRETGMYGQRIPSRDQDGYGYCWAHSSVSAVLLLRAKMGLPYADLSAFMVACIIKNYRNQGGWGAESLEFITENGIATSNTWPQQGHDRSLDTPAMRAEAKNNRILGWVDVEDGNIDQFVSLLLLGIPVVSDFNWWSHSVCTQKLVRIDPADIWGSLITDILNSWSDSWSENGAGQLKGRKALPNSMIAPLTVAASAI